MINSKIRKNFNDVRIDQLKRIKIILNILNNTLEKEKLDRWINNQKVKLIRKHYSLQSPNSFPAFFHLLVGIKSFVRTENYEETRVSL